MELGALVCTAKNPLCDQCPIGEHCAFLAAGRPGLGERRTRPRQRFQGTDRQVRGIILDALRAEPILARERLESLWPDHVQLDKCIASLTTMAWSTCFRMVHCGYLNKCALKTRR